MQRFKKITLLCLCISNIFSCQAPSGISDKSKNIEMPPNWQSISENSRVVDYQNQFQHNSQLPISSLNTLLTTIKHPQLNHYIEQAINHNYQLKAKRFDLNARYQQVISAKATNYPDLSLALRSSRSTTFNNSDDKVYQNNANIDLSVNYEIDLWGKLSAQQRQASLNFASAKASYQYSVNQLVAQITQAWFNVIEAQQLLVLLKGRAQNLQDNLAQIQASYRLGLNSALDVYLTQNNVSQALALVEEQTQILGNHTRTFELLLGDYPKDQLRINETLPTLELVNYAGLPAQLLTRRDDLNASWFQLLALDAELAIAHKQRFPKIALTASTGQSADTLNELFDGDFLAWSLIGNITTPLFNAGRLAAQQEKAKLAVQSQEQSYLQQVFIAFSDVERFLSNQVSLQNRYAYILSAQENAIAAEKLSFDQYLKGIVPYTTVLESQRRSFDSQTTLIKLQNQLLQNQINLTLALGGELPETLTSQALKFDLSNAIAE
jgi:NodT family efflux transporter outer membrane factor (OMF) lipoprotein